MDSRQDVGAEGVASDDAAFADLAAPGLELGLDKDDAVPARFQVRQGLRQRHGEGYEGDVGNQQIDGLGQVKGIADVDLLHAGYPRVLAQPVVQLAVSDVHGVDARRAALEQAVGEPAGGRPHVQGGDAVQRVCRGARAQVSRARASLTPPRLT